MIYSSEINGIPVQTGDIICTMNGKPDVLPGKFWRVVGWLVPGDVDHVAVYVGPDGRCVEAGALGVISFEVSGGIWDSEKMVSQRGLLLDTFYGIAYPLKNIGLTRDEETIIRTEIGRYCLEQVGKPYNLNFFDPNLDDAMYCSQIVYKAYLRHGINLNAGIALEKLPGANRIIFPQEIWDYCPHVADARQIQDEQGLLPQPG